MKPEKKAIRNPAGGSSNASDSSVQALKSPAMFNKARSQASASMLLAAKVIQTLKKDDTATDQSEYPGQQDANTSAPELALRHAISLCDGLVERLISMPQLPSLARNGMQANRQVTNYALSCQDDLGIWHESGDAIAILNRYPLHQAAARAELPYFVLWALHTVQPSAYQKLIGEEFGPSTDFAPNSVKALPEPIPYDEHEPPFEFKHGLVFERSSIHPTELVHTFISGTTGSGKTYGGIKPLLQSFLIYRNAVGKPMSMLVIDPKSELLQLCIDELRQLNQSDRLFRVGSGQKINAFSKTCELGVEDRYRILAGMFQTETSGDSSVWQEKGHRLNVDMATIDRVFQLLTGFTLWGVVRSLLQGQDHTQSSQWGNIHSVYKHALISRENVAWLAAVSTVLIELCPGLHGVQSVFTQYLSDSELHNQLFYRVSSAEQMCKVLSAAEVVNVVNTDLFAGNGGNDVSMEDLVDQGRVILCQPTLTHSGDIAGRLVKGRFFADVLSRRDMKQPVGYVCDEFQRYITSDRDTGEQSFMDRCRAYRVTCVVASQSLSAVEHALVLTGERAPRLVVDIIIANSPTRIIYKTLDSSTQRSLRDWLPPAPEGRLHVVDIRPPALLMIGDAYYLCNGAWGMYHYEKRP